MTCLELARCYFVLASVSAVTLLGRWIRQLARTMSAARRAKVKPRNKIFHATMLVTRAEERWIEAESLEEAEALLVAGRGHRATPGELIHAELDVMLTDEKLK